MKKLKQIICTIVSLCMIFMIIPDINYNVHAEPIVTVSDTGTQYQYTATATCNENDEVKLYLSQIFKLTQADYDSKYFLFGFKKPQYDDESGADYENTVLYDSNNVQYSETKYGDYTTDTTDSMDDYVIFKPSGSGTIFIYAECQDVDNYGVAYATCDITITVNPSSPQISSITPPSNGTYKTGDVLNFTIGYSEAVTVTGTPRFPLTIGSSTVYATYVSGSGTSALTFRYTVAAGDTDTDGIAISSPINLNGATIINASSVNAGLTFTPPVTTGILVDTTYTVTFNKNEGTTEASPTTAKTDSNGKVTLPTTAPTKDGCKFEGWYTAASGGTKFDTDTVVSSDTTVYAHWTPNTYTIIYYNVDGVTHTNPANYTYSNPVTFSDPTARTGYRFRGWYSDSGFSNQETGIKDSYFGNKDIYAKWDQIYTVTYNGNGNDNGSVPTDSSEYINSDTVTVLGNTGNLTKTGCTFGGWSTTSGGAALYQSGNTFAMGTANVTLYAVWITTPEIDVQGNGNSISSGDTTPSAANNTDFGSLNIVSGSAVTRTFTIKNTGTADLNLTGSPKVSVSGASVADFTVTQQPLSSTIAANGGSTTFTVKFDPSSTGEKTATITIESDDSDEGTYTFSVKGTGTTYTVTFNSNGGNAYSETSEVSASGTITLPATNPTRTGYDFDSWNTKEDCTGDTFTASTTIISNITVYAKWKIKHYDVTFNTDGGSTNPDTQTINYNNYAAKPTDPTKIDCRFDGWYNGTVKWDFTTGKVTDNITLTAHWISTPYTVTYDGNGATGGTIPVDIGKYADGDSVTLLGNTGNLTRTGYTFSGWATSLTGSVIKSYTMGSANVTFYAVWTKNPEYSITYSGYGNTGGTVPTDSNTYESGSAVTLAGNTGNLTKTGYTFDGWATSPTGSAIKSYTIGSTNVTFYAVWRAISKTYTITYNGNGNDGGTVPNDSNTYQSSLAVTLAGNTGNLTKTGYTFGGWATSPTGSTIKSYTIGSSNVTFYAVWNSSSSSDNSSSSSSSSSTTNPVNITQKEPFLEENGGTGKTITDKLEAAKDDKPVEIDMNGSTTVQSEWLETIAGEDIDMVLDMGNGITWTINGKSITGTDFSNINLGVITNLNKIPVDVINNITREKNVKQLTFKYEGSLGFTATLTIDLDKKNRGLIANLYYYNEDTKQLKFQSSSKIRDDGTTDMKFLHFSSYAVVIDKKSLAPEDVAAGAGAESDNSLVY